MRRVAMAATAVVVALAPVLSACEGTIPAAGAPATDGPTEYVEPLPARTFPVVVTPTHCWIDPLRIDGELWGVDRRDQFGWGDGAPKGWNVSGRGVATEQGNHLVFTADEGATLRLWPVGHRFYSDPAAEGRICY